MRGWAIALGLLVWLHTGRAGADERYLGSQACGACHAPELETWRRGPHARAAASLRGDERRDPRCLGCHTTGMAPVGRPALPAVGCEACHGPGRAYAPEDIMRNPALARALGLARLDTPTRRASACGACHVTRTRLGPFDPEAAWRRIGHGPAATAQPVSGAEPPRGP